MIGKSLATATLMAIAMIILPCGTLNAQGSRGQVTIQPNLIYPQRVAEFTLYTGDEVDYSYNAAGEVSFYVIWDWAMIKWQELKPSGQGTFKADKYGTYVFAFLNPNTTDSVTVTYDIHPPRSWLPQLIVLAVGALVALILAFIVLKKPQR